MNKKELLDNLTALESSIKNNQQILKSKNETLKPSIEIKNSCQKIALSWFELIESNLSEYEIDVVIIKKYHELFDELLKIGVSTARIRSYKNNLANIITKFKEEIIIVIMKSS